MSNCSIVIPIWNRLDDTKECINSIRKNTVYQYKLILIDNASDTETKTYLERLHAEMPDRVKLIRNEKNKGFIKAVNSGIRKVESELVCVLNNDTVVTPGWLGELVKIFDENPKVAIVNPSSNTLGQILPNKTTVGQELQKLKKESGLFVELGSAFGFCMLVRKKLFDEIGMFDECYGMGYFEDTDFSLRAKEKGYKAVRALASYVFHKEKKSFSLFPSFKSGFKRNKKIFESKWGKIKRTLIFVSCINEDSVNRIDELLKKNVQVRSWVYVISPYFDTENLYRKYSNLTFYHFKKHPYIFAFFKIIFKKKKSDIIFCQKNFFYHVLRFCKMLHTSEVKAMY